jgi:cysteine desulfurase family protein (TIGR01976 family)
MVGPEFDVQYFRECFPYFGEENPDPSICLDAVGGTQVPQTVIDAISDHLIHRNGNKGGIFRRSVETDEMMDDTRAILADFINADDPDELFFGQSFTANTFNVSRALARTWQPGDEIIVSRLDHDANVSPWLMAAEDAGVTVKHLDIEEGSCQLTPESLAELVTDKTRLVTFCAASSSVGTKPDVAALTEVAHEAGALVYVDAVAYAPHDSIDVKKWDADFVGFSTYKFFGPHVSVLWGRRQLLEDLPAYKIRPAPDTLPLRWLNGAQSYETIAGVKACIEYLGHVGSMNQAYADLRPEFTGIKSDLFAGMAAIKDYEEGLTWQLIDRVKETGRFTLWGIDDEALKEERVPTIALSLEDGKANDIAMYLAANGIDIWSRSVYSKSLSERLGLEQTGGFIRVGFAHYNTAQEVDTLMDALEAFEPGRHALKA